MTSQQITESRKWTYTACTLYPDLTYNHMLRAGYLLLQCLYMCPCTCASVAILYASVYKCDLVCFWLQMMHPLTHKSTCVRLT